MFGNENRHAGSDSKSNRIAWAAVDIDQFTIGLADLERGKERVFREVVDGDRFEFAAKVRDHVGEQVVRLRALDNDAFQATVDCLSFGEADDDGKAATLAANFFPAQTSVMSRLTPSRPRASWRQMP